MRYARVLDYRFGSCARAGTEGRLLKRREADGGSGCGIWLHAVVRRGWSCVGEEEPYLCATGMNAYCRECRRHRRVRSRGLDKQWHELISTILIDREGLFVDGCVGSPVRLPAGGGF
ncbi:hypothetical protein KFK09_005469 [Dendrobium nobile]|uniref:Uncharacterized protein n=1 Tax=Dendrobium nobile TaxID=94219 RepID=A0A8T3C121_DENNO|nr:hypothetical protein KFK09_005469 [Dendrobium nobile]